jgi:hypothetical protein
LHLRLASLKTLADVARQLLPDPKAAAQLERLVYLVGATSPVLPDRTVGDILTADQLDRLTRQHRYFSSSDLWRLGRDGVAIQHDATALCSEADYAQVLKVFTEHLAEDSCERFLLPSRRRTTRAACASTTAGQIAGSSSSIRLALMQALMRKPRFETPRCSAARLG